MPACKTCGENITWTEPEKGKWVPVEGDGYTRHRCQAKGYGSGRSPTNVISMSRPSPDPMYQPPQTVRQPLPYNTPARREPDTELAHQLNRVAESLDRVSELMREFLAELRKPN